MVLNGDIFVLVREEEPSDNRVCEKCALFDICFNHEGIPGYTIICEAAFPGQGCFFVNANELTKFQQEEVKYYFLARYSSI